MIICGTRDNSVCERFPWKSDLTLSKAISSAMLLRKQVGMTAKFSDLNLPSTSIRFLKGNSVSQIITLATRKQRNLQKSLNFGTVHTTEANVQLMERFVMFSIKKPKVCCQRVHEKVHEIVRNESGEHSDQSHHEFFI